MDRISPENRSRLMSKVKNKDTDIEIIMRKALWKEGVRFRIKLSLPGKPDIVILKNKVAIFCDGDFWHGKTYKKDRTRYKEFWKDKIRLNMERDQRVDEILRKEGWTVLRLWKSDILKHKEECVKLCMKYLL